MVVYIQNGLAMPHFMCIYINILGVAANGGLFVPLLRKQLQQRLLHDQVGFYVRREIDAAIHLSTT
jgi:hypothetical protein